MLVGENSLRRLEAVGFIKLLNRVESWGKYCKVLGLEVWLLVKVKLLLSSALGQASLLKTKERNHKSNDITPNWKSF